MSDQKIVEIFTMEQQFPCGKRGQATFLHKGYGSGISDYGFGAGWICMFGGEKK